MRRARERREREEREARERERRDKRKRQTMARRKRKWEIAEPSVGIADHRDRIKRLFPTRVPHIILIPLSLPHHPSHHPRSHIKRYQLLSPLSLTVVPHFAISWLPLAPIQALSLSHPLSSHERLSSLFPDFRRAAQVSSTLSSQIHIR